MTTTKYPEALLAAQELIPEFGTTVTVRSPVKTIVGQQVDRDTSTYDSYVTPAVLTTNYSSRQSGYTRTDNIRLLMPNIGNRSPRAGDVFVFPDGRRYIAETVSALRPDGVALVWDVIVSDG